MSGGRTVDLDAARVARAEIADDPPVVTLGGDTYELTRELPLEFGDLVATGRLRLAAGILLADVDQVEAFMANKPTVEDLVEIADLYDFQGLGESRASRRSSKTTSKRSRPTS